MKQTIALLKKQLKKQFPTAGKKRILISFSGGSDSVFLVEMLLSIGCKHLQLIYFNHHLRPENELKLDIDFCLSYAAKRNLNITIKSIPVTSFKKKYRISEEEAARFLRRQFLIHVATLRKINTVVMAHHYDDQLETLCIKMKQGLHRFQNPLKTTTYLTPKIVLMRPLLGITKNQILLYLNQNKLTFSEDSSNANMIYLRNTVRNAWLPFLKQYAPHVIDMLRKTAELHTLIDERVNIMTLQYMFNLAKINCNSLNDFTEFQCKQQLYSLCQSYYQHSGTNRSRLHFEDFYLTTAHIDAMNNLLGKNTGKFIDLPNHRVCYKAKNDLFFMTKQTLLADINFSIPVTNFNQVVVIEKIHKAITIKIVENPTTIKQTKNRVVLSIPPSDLNHVIIRNHSLDDIFHVLGTSYKKRVKDYLSDHHCDWFQRKYVPIIEINNKIAWIAGYSIADPFHISNTLHSSHYFIELNIETVPFKYV
ncbi:tRNA lysidine(34) synthetase TilS [Candidatus Marinamargulisbacteria bacterium SCGC AG-414-C22]|nr:tRNA lysidine(34) synthetase TilS [Candidatus Marinamargulisbacteria bacterium SCGC AG-414-C22]